MNYKQKYEEALERAKYLKENTDSIGAKDISYNFEYIFPELKESEDERIRKAIVKMISDIDGGFPFEKHGIIKKKALAWLEKQANIPHFTFDDILALQCAMKAIEKADNELYEQLKSLHDRLHDVYWLEKQGEQIPADKVEPKFKKGDWVVSSNGKSTDYQCEVTDWLKSIKPRWKPTKLQLEALEAAYKQLPNIKYPLESLYNDLKSL